MLKLKKFMLNKSVLETTITFLFCAGEGVRLQPLTLETPKPFIPLDNGRIIIYKTTERIQERARNNIN